MPLVTANFFGPDCTAETVVPFVAAQVTDLTFSSSLKERKLRGLFPNMSWAVWRALPVCQNYQENCFHQHLDLWEGPFYTRFVPCAYFARNCIEGSPGFNQLRGMGPAVTWKQCSSVSKESCFCCQPHLVISEHFCTSNHKALQLIYWQHLIYRIIES